MAENDLKVIVKAKGRLKGTKLSVTLIIVAQLLPDYIIGRKLKCAVYCLAEIISDKIKSVGLSSCKICKKRGLS